ncbi:helix-turn-helix domain-containing protein [Fertoebacter nigrum]|uniref:Helix-turn-helix domain-containing protein n=1 Tax=Fertoeibacter niger TaxID=2656921 RepID=A0A8X8KQM2_9RHOB|nr:helix-turn-helix domain-containing protein [Fertoeibacter niger]NUB44227.1 helix-turn-helix domain-containing protein [Fertoeibacter niger]
MEMNEAIRAFSALGHHGRLAVFRLLMRHAPHGVRAGEIAEALHMRPNTLSSNLALLEGAGLIRSCRDGRAILYCVNLPVAGSLAAYFVHNAGRSRPELTAPLTHSPTTDQKDNSAMPALNDTDFDVLFICSGNSARSIFAEALLRDIGKGKFQAFSAGTRPGTELNPFALEVLVRNGHDVSGMRSKHISEFQAPGMPVMDFVFTVCDTAANEECPPWPGQPITGHWGLPDPVKVTGTDAEKGLAFAQAYADLRRRISAFAALPFETLNRVALQTRVDQLGDKAKT